MNKYETTFLMKNHLTKEQKNKIINTIKNYLNENGKVTDAEECGEKISAYRMNEHKMAYFYFIEFNAKPEVVKELERIYRSNDNIIKLSLDDDFLKTKEDKYDEFSSKKEENNNFLRYDDNEEDED